MKTFLEIMPVVAFVILVLGCSREEARMPVPTPAPATPAERPDPLVPPKDLPNRIDLAAAVVPLKAGGRDVARAVPGLFEGRVVLVEAGGGTAESLFVGAPVLLRMRLAAACVEPALAAAMGQGGTGLTFWGEYTDGKVSVPFRRKILSAEGGRVTVTETADFTKLPKAFALAEHALVLPLVVAKDEHDRMLAFGAEGRVEMFRMDMNDEDHRAQSISDNRGFQPYWDIGRVLQLPTGFVVSRANHADTPNYVLDGGTSAPGWADYSEMDRGFTIRVLEPAKAAPWALMIDARKGEFVVSPRPADQPPIGGADYGKREFAFEMTLHEGSWPAAFPCELPPDVYLKFLGWLDGAKHLGNACGNIGVSPSKDKDTLYRNIVFRNRVQPSVLLRVFYRADAWRMSQIATQLLGRNISRNQPLDQWEKIAQEVIEKLRKDGVPEPKP